MSITFQSEPNGYSIQSNFDNVYSAVKIEISEDSSIVASSVSLFGSVPTVDSDWKVLDGKSSGHWVYSMLTGEPSLALLDILNVPHVVRSELSEETLVKAKDFAEKHLSSFSREALDAMKDAPDKKLMTYNFLSVSGDRGLYRRQAAQVYPIFADILNSNISTKMAIDRKKPLNDILIPLMSDIAGAPIGKAFLKRFSKAPALPEGHRLSSVIRFAAHIQPDWFPTSNEEWTAFYHVASTLIEDIKVLPEQLPDMLKGSKGKWVELVNRALIKAFPDVDDPAHLAPFESFRMSALNMRDTLENFNDMAVVPIVCHAQESDDVYLNKAITSSCEKWGWDILFDKRTLPDSFEVSRHFHQKQAEIINNTKNFEANRLLAKIEENEWPGLTAPVQAPNGLWIIPLLSPKELSAEGRELTHCVGGYATKAKTCASHIVSVKEVLPNGKMASLSTCEFTSAKKKVPDTLEQRMHCAKNNRRPNEMACDAIRWYKQSIESGSIPIQWDLIRAFLDDNLIVMDQVEKLCGYDWRDRESLDRAISQWGPYVTKPYRSKGTDDLLDCERVSDIIEIMTPDFLSSHSS